MRVGAALLELARATGAPSLFFIGTGKNAGKTVAMRAVYEAACVERIVCGLTSIGRDGEALDIADANDKPRLWLQPRTVVATARTVLPSSPASELLDTTRVATAAGHLAYARVRTATNYELIGPPTASGIARCIDRLLHYAEYALIDGAIDRVTALANTASAAVVSCGASGAATMDEAVEDVRALVRRLAIPAFTGDDAGAVDIDSALTPTRTNALIAARERRPIVIADPTKFMLTGRAASTALDRLTIRCRRPLHVVAATVASIGRERNFEPRAFAQAVREATLLPTFDVYAGTHAA